MPVGDTIRRWTNPQRKYEANFKSTIQRGTKNTNIQDLMAYLHASYFSPDIITFIDVAKWGYFSGWTILTTTNIRKYLPKSEATNKHHMDQTRKTQDQQNRAYRKAI